MSEVRKTALARFLNLPFSLAVLLTVVFYLFVAQEAMKDTLIYRYTTEHNVEYVIVAFFIWGLTDVLFRACTFPRELLALRQEWLPRRTGRESVARAASLRMIVRKKPQWLLESRMGLRLSNALGHLDEKGSADEFSDYLRYLSDQDYEWSTANYGLVRFICWVTPMFGFLGTVVHFGTALGGQSAGDISEKLPTVVSEMGTAFNTTTVALIAATTMMFCLFLCERVERGILQTVDRETERALLHRFEIADANMTPFLAAVQAASQASLRAMDATLAAQLEAWTKALDALQRDGEKQQQWQAQVWVEALERLEQRFDSNDEAREKRITRVLDALKTQRQEHDAQSEKTVAQIAALQADFSKLVEALGGMAQTKGELVPLQAALSDNLRLLRETQQIDQALHGLTAAIHLMTARGQNAPPKGRAA